MVRITTRAGKGKGKGKGKGVDLIYGAASARAERDGASRGRVNFQQKIICDPHFSSSCRRKGMRLGNFLFFRMRGA